MPALLAAVLAAGVAGAAHTTPALADTAFAATSTVDIASSMRDLVWRMSDDQGMPPEVRSAAYVAFRAGTDAAIREFISSGYRKASDRATERARMNDWYIKDINRTAIPGSWVQVTSARATVSSKAAQDEYVQSGYEWAKEQDRINDNKHDERLARLAEEDRDYVTFLAANDPGVQVRAAAKRAIAGDDRAIGFFFKYGWKNAADVDTEMFVQATMEQNQIWHDRIRVLTELALAAEKAEREASGELARKHRLEAKGKWEEIDREAGRSSVDWLAEKGRADAAAAMWARIAEDARNAQTEQDWAAILKQALKSNTSWEGEANWARDQAATWQAIAEQARKAARDATERDLGDR